MKKEIVSHKINGQTYQVLPEYDTLDYTTDFLNQIEKILE